MYQIGLIVWNYFQTRSPSFKPKSGNEGRSSATALLSLRLRTMNQQQERIVCIKRKLPTKCRQWLGVRYTNCRKQIHLKERPETNQRLKSFSVWCGHPGSTVQMKILVYRPRVRTLSLSFNWSWIMTTIRRIAIKPTAESSTVFNALWERTQCVSKVPEFSLRILQESQEEETGWCYKDFPPNLTWWAAWKHRYMRARWSRSSSCTCACLGKMHLRLIADTKTPNLFNAFFIFHKESFVDAGSTFLIPMLRYFWKTRLTPQLRKENKQIRLPVCVAIFSTKLQYGHNWTLLTTSKLCWAMIQLPSHTSNRLFSLFAMSWATDKI